MEAFEFEKLKALIIVEIIEYVPDSVVIKTIIKKTTGNISAVSFDTGEKLEEKTSLNSNNNKGLVAVKKKLYVKYMICLRDKLLLKSVLNKQGLNYRISVHGAIEFFEEITKVQYHELKMGLSKSGLILLDEKESMLIDRIINTIVEIIHYTDTLPKLDFRDIIILTSNP